MKKTIIDKKCIKSQLFISSYARMDFIATTHAGRSCSPILLIQNSGCDYKCSFNMRCRSLLHKLKQDQIWWLLYGIAGDPLLRGFDCTEVYGDAIRTFRIIYLIYHRCLLHWRVSLLSGFPLYYVLCWPLRIILIYLPCYRYNILSDAYINQICLSNSCTMVF